MIVVVWHADRKFIRRSTDDNLQRARYFIRILFELHKIDRKVTSKTSAFKVDEVTHSDNIGDF